MMDRFRWKVSALLLYAATIVISTAQTLTNLATFNGTNGQIPSVGSLVQGADADLYGTTGAGGANGLGTVFKITLEGTLTTLYSFDGTMNFGTSWTSQAGLTQGSDGNLYGTTALTVFKITPGGTLTTLYRSDPSSTDGEFFNGLVQASDGNFYGTTGGGGANSSGTVFKISPQGSLTTIYSFGVPPDGINPSVGLIQASDGNFYGTTSHGGASGIGTIFRITPTGTLTTLHSFYGADGSNPNVLIQATDGNLYGTTQNGGANSYGTVFKITLGGALTTVYSFLSSTDGAYPYAGVIQGNDGNFYGTTPQGGPSSGPYGVGGTIFRMTPGGTLTTLYTFESNSEDGFGPGGLVQASDGNLYGTTLAGVGSSNGIVFKLALTSSGLASINQSSGVVSAASFQAGVVASSWVTIIGTNLSAKTDTWATAIVNGKLPTALDGVSVTVGEQPAYISYISPTQINALAPNIAPGTVSVTVTNPGGTSSPINVVVQTVQPAFFQWGSYAVATRQDYSLAVKNGTFSGVTTTPAKPGDVIILWGTGFGRTSPSAPVGAEVPSDATYNTASTVTVSVGGVPATVYGAALAPGYAGLYQVAIQIPGLLANGDYPVTATISGAASPATTLITVQN
jgi:uncharacterized protein (TIGR03437 family)